MFVSINQYDGRAAFRLASHALRECYSCKKCTTEEGIIGGLSPEGFLVTVLKGSVTSERYLVTVGLSFFVSTRVSP